MDSQEFFDSLNGFGRVLAIKLYRVQPASVPPVPTLPCLDHEAMLHETIGAHASVYFEDKGGSLHEVALYPDDRKIHVDTASTIGECPPEAHERFLNHLRSSFNGFSVVVSGPSWLNGDQRVAKACRAQVTLREVLTGDNLDRTKAAIDRLLTISSLMEKESRVASWGARTVMTPLLAVAGLLTYQIVGVLVPRLGTQSVALIRYTIVGLLGAFFLYYGMKAVHLTRMANRVWKRATEYGLILTERRRLMK